MKGKRKGGGSEPGTSRPEAHHGAVGIGRLPVRMERDGLEASAVRARPGHPRTQPVRRSYSPGTKMPTMPKAAIVANIDRVLIGMRAARHL